MSGIPGGYSRWAYGATEYPSVWKSLQHIWKLSQPRGLPELFHEWIDKVRPVLCIHCNWPIYFLLYCDNHFRLYGDHIAVQFRVKFLSSVLRQNIEFLDTIGAGEMTTRITTDTNLIQEGISEKVGVSLIACSNFVAAFVISFIIYWRLTLILSSTVFAFLFTLGGLSRFMVKYHVVALSRYTEGVTVVEESISAIRNVFAFNAQKKKKWCVSMMDT